MNLARRISQISPSATLSINARAKEMIREGRSVINLSSGEPDFDTPSSIKKAAIQAIKEGFTKYTPTQGVLPLVEAVREKFQRDSNLDYSPSEVIISAGAKQILYNALQVICNPGDEVIIPQPFWVSYPEQVRLAEAVPIYVSLKGEDWSYLEAKEIAKNITPGKTKVVILNTPHNPSGAVLRKSVLESIAEVILPEDIYVISDEIYEKYIYEGSHFSFASLGKKIKEKTLTINGVSKTFSMTGWRIGYAGGPEKLISAMRRLQAHSTSCSCSISQYAALRALKNSQERMGVIMEEFKKRRDCMVSRLNGLEGIKLASPPGAFYAFVDFSPYLGAHYQDWKINNSQDLANYLLEKAEVAVVPGSAFGIEGWARLSYALSIKEIEEAMDRVKQVLTDLRKGD